MITWITNKIATAAYTELSDDIVAAGIVADVRDLVDKRGNTFDALNAQIKCANEILKQHGKVYIACDMGVSRSRVIAIGLLIQTGWSFDAALSQVRQTAKKPEINIALLQTLAKFLNKSSLTPNAADRSKLLILGGSGFVGTHILNALSVQNVVCAPSSSQINLTTDGIELSRFIDKEGCRIIIYAAHPKSYHSVSAFSSSLGMLKNALEIARLHNLTFVYISSMVVFYGNARLVKKSEFSANDNNHPVPFGTYSESKFFGESLIQLYMHNFSLKAAIVRAPGLYGPGMSGAWVIPKFINKALKDLPIVTHKYLNGLPKFELLHIRDFCSGVEALLGQEKIPDIVHIGGSSLISTHELAQTIVELVQSKSPVSLLQIEDQVYNVSAVTSDIMERLGWSPAVTLNDGLNELIGYAKQEV